MFVIFYITFMDLFSLLTLAQLKINIINITLYVISIIFTTFAIEYIGIVIIGVESRFVI